MLRRFRLTTRRQLALALAGLAAIAALAIPLNIFEMRSVERTIRDLERMLALTDDLDALDSAVASIFEAERAYSLSGDPRFLGEELRARQAYADAAARYETDQRDDTEAERRRSIQSLVDDWLENVGHPWLQAREREEDVTAYAEAADASVKTIRRGLADARVRITTASAREREAMQVRSRVRMRVASALCALVIAAAGLLWLMLERKVFAATSSINSWVKRLVKGEFGAEAPRLAAGQHSSLVASLVKLNSASEERERDLRAQLSRERQLGREHAAIVHEMERERDNATGALAAVPAAMIVLEKPTGRVLYQNEAATQLVGAHNGHLSTSQHRRRFRLYSLKGRPCTRKDLPLERVFAGETVGGLPLRLRALDGRLLPILVSAAPLRDARGRTTAAAIIAQTIV